MTTNDQLAKLCLALAKLENRAVSLLTLHDKILDGLCLLLIKNDEQIAELRTTLQSAQVRLTYLEKLFKIQ